MSRVLRTKAELPTVAIAGMHRSGASMVAEALRIGGLYLGEPGDLTAGSPTDWVGLWEHREFARLNDAILADLGGGWDSPPPMSHTLAERGRTRRSRRAKLLVGQLDGAKPWGWKDPRNSLTLPFWIELLPDLKVVVCVRNPLEVAESLKTRGASLAFSLRLWSAYNERIVAATTRDQRIVTHYDAHFTRPALEVERLFSLLDLPVESDVVERASAVVDPELRHSRFTLQELLDSTVEPAVVALYAQLQTEAEWRDDGAGARGSRTSSSSRARSALRARTLRTPRRALERVAAKGSEDREHLSELSGLVEQLDSRIAALRNRLTQERKKTDLELDGKGVASDDEHFGEESVTSDSAFKQESDDLRELAVLLRGQTEALAELCEMMATQSAELSRLGAAVDALSVQPVHAGEATTEAAEAAKELTAPTSDRLDVVRRIKDVVIELVPAGDTVAVVSKGDDALVAFGDRVGWHFPQAPDGKYAGFYPANSDEAITHLEEVRKRGARFLVIPATAVWWLEFYEDFRAHLEARYVLIVHDAACLIFDLRRRRRKFLPAVRRPRAGRITNDRGGDVSTPKLVFGRSTPSRAKRMAVLREFDPDFYRVAYPTVSGTDRELLDDFLTSGWKLGRNPNRWFSTEYYLSQNSDARDSGINPFVHYVMHGRAEGRLPNSYRSAKRRTGYWPTVSAIVPNFNHARFLGSRIASITHQRRLPDELIILDDASRDTSRQVIEALTQKLTIPVKTVFNATNSGNVFKQWQKGISLASGDLIWVCESDDFCDEGFLESLVPYFSDPSITLAFGRIQFANAEGRLNPWLDEYREGAAAGYWESPRVASAYEWFRGPFGLLNVIPNVSGCLFRRQELPATVWKEAQRYSVCGDWYLYAQLAAGGRLAYDPTAISYFRQHEANTSVVSFTNLGFYEEHFRIARELRRVYGIDDARVCAFYQRVLDEYLRHFEESRKPEFQRIFDLHELVESRRSKRHILIGILGFTTGGAEIFAINLANELVERDQNVSLLVLSPEEENSRIRRLVKPQIPIYERPLVDEIGLGNFLETHGIDLVHTHFLGVDLWLHQACRETGTPYVVTLQGSYEVGGLDAATTRSLLRSVDRWVYKADKNLRPFDGLALDSTTFTKLPNAVQVTDETFSLSRADLGIEDDAFVFGIASRALISKGWAVGIAALQRMRSATDRPVHLVLCGDGPDYVELRARYKERPGVHFIGYRSSIIAFYRLCDCCLLPTRFLGESFPLTLIESLHAGTPIIATDIGEIPRIVRQGSLSAGIIVPNLPDDHEFVSSVTEAMLRMLDDGERSRYAKAAKRIAREHSFERLTTSYEEIYESVIDSRAER